MLRLPLFESPISQADLLAIIFLSLVFLITLFLILRWLFYRLFILKDEMKSADGFVSTPDLTQYIGQRGITVTVLRPVGTIEIDGRRFDARSNSDFIERGRKVVVHGIDGAQLVIDPAEDGD